jgi:hypothetical protein
MSVTRMAKTNNPANTSVMVIAPPDKFDRAIIAKLSA